MLTPAEKAAIRSLLAYLERARGWRDDLPWPRIASRNAALVRYGRLRRWHRRRRPVDGEEGA